MESSPPKDRLQSRQFHHVELFCGDATSSLSRFVSGIGADLVAMSDFSTGNPYANSYVVQTGNIRMIFTAPTITPTPRDHEEKEEEEEHSNLWQSGSETGGGYALHNDVVFPGFSTKECQTFFHQHGLAVKAVGLEVDDVLSAYQAMIKQKAVAILPPTRVIDSEGRGSADIAEVLCYGNVVLRLINVDRFKGSFFPNYKDTFQIDSSNHQLPGRYLLHDFDHIVGNVYNLSEALDYIQTITGFHEFAGFDADEVGTQNTGLNSVVMANTNHRILMPVNEPTYSTKKKSQILTYLEQNQGPGVQHLALLTNDIFATLKKMRAAAREGCGFTFQAPPPPTYYQQLKERLGSALSVLTEEQLQLAEEFGVLIDGDKRGNMPGLLLQIFTRPLADRPTIFFEIIQRVGCVDPVTKEQVPGCGGFGKGNFGALFRSIEEYETALGINKIETETSSPTSTAQ
eukprot:gene4476-4903_t